MFNEYEVSVGQTYYVSETFDTKYVRKNTNLTR